MLDGIRTIRDLINELCSMLRLKALERNERPLITALAKGDISLVIKVINKRPFLSNTWVPTSDHAHSATLLHWAVRIGNRDLVQLLLDQDANINAFDANGNTPLENACNNGDISVIELLLSHGASVNLRETTKSAIAYAADESVGNAPLTTAAARGHIDIVRLLIGKGAHICPDSGGYTKTHFDMRPLKNPILVAIQNGHEDVVKYLVKKDHKHIIYDENTLGNEHNDYFIFLMEWALRDKQDSIACFLINEWAPTTKVLNANAGEVLRRVKQYNCKNAAALLIEKGLKEDEH